MKSAKRLAKEEAILDAAEVIFSRIGLDKTRMEDIAREQGMSKGSIYFYFESKENLYLAVTLRAFRFLIKKYADLKEAGAEQNGKETTLELLKYYMDFCKHQPGYNALLMNYMKLFRSEYNGSFSLKKLKETPYFRLLKEMHHQPIKMVVEEIKRGQQDGSISNSMDANLLYLMAWAQVAGFTELSGNSKYPEEASVYSISVKEWKKQTILLVNRMLEDKTNYTDDEVVITR